MLRLLADENFNNKLVRALLRHDSELDVVRVQEVGLSGADDAAVLAWAAVENRILLTHDVSTITRYAYDRVRAGLSMPGVFEVASESAIGTIVEDILLLIECSLPDEWQGQVRYLPLR